MTEYYPDVMVDIETTGLEPDRSAILQIGAVKFNLKERTVDPKVFDQSLSMPNFRHWDMGTRHWWAQKPPSIMQDIQARSQPYKTVMENFQQWSLPSGSLKFWAKPTHFDFMFISSYFRDCDLVNPFSYRDAEDMNSFIRGRYFPEKPDSSIEKNTKIDGPAHNALNDCFWQLKVLFAHCDKLGI